MTNFHSSDGPRTFQVTIRELLILMVTAAISFGWLVDRWQLEKFCAKCAKNAQAAARR